MPHEQPESAIEAGREPRNALVAIADLTEVGLSARARPHQLATGQALELDRAVDIEGVTRILLKADLAEGLDAGEVFAPLLVSLFVGDPDPARLVTGDAGPRLESG